MIGRVGPFALDAELGRGGMGVVYAARHLPTGTPVALKALGGGSSAGRTAFEREISAIATLHHPNVARVLDRGVAAPGEPLPEGAPWFVMERATGSLDRSGPLGGDEALGLLRALLDALAHAHGHGVLHRDVKPANVLRLADRWVLADFGMARVVDARGERGGTPGFIAPEQAAGRIADEGPWTDLFALGQLAAAMVAGQPPSGFATWLAGAREPDPRRRFRSAAEARFALHQIADPAALRAPPPRVSAPTLPSAAVPDPIEALPAVRHPVGPPGPLPPRHLPPPLPPGLGVQVLDVRTSPVLGRDHERDQLWRLFTEATQSRAPRRVALVGPAGAGKSRLARWLAAEAHARCGAEWLHVRGGDPGALAAAALRWMGGAADPGRVAARLTELGASDEAAPALAAWMAGSPTDPGTRGAFARTLVEAAAALRSVIVIVDDAHELEPTELRALAEVAGPIVVLATARPATHAASAAGFDVLALDPLGDDAVIELLDVVAGLSPSLVSQVVASAAGNPRSAALRVMGPLRRGELVAGPDGLCLVPHGALDPPDESLDPWEQTLAQHMPGGAHRAVALAALLDPPFVVDDWRSLVGGEVPLDALVRGQVLELDGGSARFTHGLLRDAALARARRDGSITDLHARVLTWALERGSTDPELLGRHALAAGDPARAAPWLRRALFLAVSQTRLGAADALDRQLELALSMLPAPHPLRPEHLLERARLAWLRARHAEALDGLAAGRAALAEAGDPAFGAVFCWLEAMIHSRDGRYASARSAIQAGLAWPGISATLKNRLERMQARVARDEGDGATSLRLLEDALRRTDPTVDPQGVLDLHISLAVLFHLGDLPERARHHYQACIAIAEGSSAGFGLVEATLNLAELERWVGDLPATRVGLERAARLGRRLGQDDQFLGVARAMLARAQGRVDDERGLLEALAARGVSPAHLHLLEHVALAGDGAAWDHHARQGASALRSLDLDLGPSLRRAFAESERRGWQARIDALLPDLELMERRLALLRRGLREALRHGV